ncbi:MAG: fluoride efflux transporter CrcB [Spirochaetota bacterium]
MLNKKVTLPVYLQYLLVGLGSFLGGCLRYWVFQWVDKSQRFSGFLYGTLVANFLGTLLIAGITFYFARDIPDRYRFFITVGFCGGFTTFSTFSFEVFLLLEKSLYGQALLYVVASLSLSLLAIATMYYIFHK